MTNKERAMNILHYKSVDRLPAVHFGYWNELLSEWADMGLISRELAAGWRDGNDVDRELNRILGWDFDWGTCVSGKRRLLPPFETKVLEVLPNGDKRVQNPYGIIERICEGVVSIPAEDDYQLKDRKSFEELYKWRMQYSDDRVDAVFFQTLNLEERDYPLGINVGSILGDVRNMLSVIGLSYTICDDYELLGEIIDTYADMQYAVAKKTLETGAKFDFAHFWEDVCFKNGPLISPVMFEELCAKHYKRMTDLLHSYGIDIVSLDCDGVIDMLLPIWLENGVNTMFPIEVGVWGASIKPWREQYGKRLLGVGGMDKTVLRLDRAAVDAELERLKPLIALGGYLPCPDHRLMPGTKFELVQYYIEKIKQMTYTA